MPLDYLVEKDSFESLDENVKGLYVEDGERFRLDVNGVKTQQDVDNVLDAKGKEKEAHKLTKQDLAKFRDENQTLKSQLADAMLTGDQTSEEIQKRLDDALKVKIAPYEDEKQALVNQNKEYATLIEGYKTKELEGELKTKIMNIINAPKSNIKPSAFEDIYSRAMRSDIGLKKNQDVNDFVDSENRPMKDWLEVQIQKSPLWLKKSTSADAGGGDKDLNSTKNRKQTTKELMDDVWGGR